MRLLLTQSPPFLALQRTRQVVEGRNNGLTFSGITQIPSDHQIRNLLDPVPPSALLGAFAAVEALHHGAHRQAYRALNGNLRGGMDATSCPVFATRSAMRNTNPGSCNLRRIRILRQFLHDFQKDPTAILPGIEHTGCVARSTIRDDQRHRPVSLAEPDQFSGNPPDS